ncbi:MAG: hypothetical protein KGI91_05735 [Burkholderiales bacterium]|nr:hypothetical protein [Burkholderiales bacterium]
MPHTAQELRSELMAPETTKRVHALHVLELELEHAPETKAAKELEALTARGIPFYSPEDPHYCDWVSKAITLWERVQHEHDHPVPVMRASHHRVERVKAIATERARIVKGMRV